MRMRWRIVLGAALAAAVGALPATPPVLGATWAPCKGAALGGTFKAVPGSAGAGNIVYRLRVENTSPGTCFVTGIPQLTLLDSRGTRLPTHAISGGRPGALAAIVVPLATGRSASLTARFSPDVPGPGEPVSAGPCERTAVELRVAPSGGGSAVVPIRPTTPVCEHGTMSLTVFTAA